MKPLVYAGIGLLALATAAAAQPAPAPATPVLPPLMNPATQAQIGGKIVFEQLTTPDLDASKRFYGGLFGWTFQDTSLGHSSVFSLATLNGQAVGALVSRAVPPGQQAQPAWLNFIAAPDAGATETQAVAQGAKLLWGPRSVPDLGQVAILDDPQGAPFGILTSASGDQPDMLAPVGAWIWHALLTRDPGADAGFYQTVFGYQVFPLGTPAQQPPQLLLASADFARASVNPLPAGHADAHPYWLGFVRVADVDAAAARAQSLGGRVLLTPRMDRHGGRIAVVSDPMGAPVGLMEWREQAAAGAAK